MARQVPTLELLFVVVVPYLAAQPPVARQNQHERIWVVVLVIGRGTPEDPRRPAYVPGPPARGSAPEPDGIVGFTAHISDDGRFAPVEFVARDRVAFREILADTRAEVKVFEKGKARPEDIEQEFRKHKRDFSFERMGVTLP